jgi:hypothetical protein
MAIPLGTVLRRPSSDLPGSLFRCRKPDGPSLRLPYLVLHRMGFALPSASRRTR